MNTVTSYMNCNGCPYCPANVGNSCPPANGNHQSLLPIGLEDNSSNELLVFQAPGTDEWTGNTCSQNRIPIDSTNPHSAAARMRASFSRKKVKRQDYDITEAVQCYPGKGSNGRDKKPRKKAIACCQQYLEKTILRHNYSKIVCFGNVAHAMVTNIINQHPHLSSTTVTLAPHPSGGLSNTVLDNSY